MRITALLCLLFINLGFAQSHKDYIQIDEDTAVNLVPNGSFSAGNIGFRSDFTYSKKYGGTGYYSITRNAAILADGEYTNPVEGDHTSGFGPYMIIDSDGVPGKKAWCSTVQVIPNAVYQFSVYFCNLYREQAATSSFGFTGSDAKSNNPRIRLLVNGKQVGRTEADIYRFYRWVKASTTWYSGQNSGPIEICIENVNYSARGNDLALDDIGFYLAKQMPKDYVPFEVQTVMIQPDEPVKYDKRIRFLKSGKGNGYNEFALGDSVAPGIYSIYSTHVEPVTKVTPGDTIVPGKKINLPHAVFMQSKADLTAETKEELDKLAQWLFDHPEAKIRLEGHTDNQGDYYLNISLSEDRVRNVKKYLVGKGIDPDRIGWVGYGGTKPIASNAKEETRKLNRRVVFEVLE